MRRVLAVFLFAVVAVDAQAVWKVKQRWVQADEDFLASDVLQGRGSATRDEGIAASYVASQFLSFGLQTAPGMKSFLQSAEVEFPKLDGHAVLHVGNGMELEEGRDFRLVSWGPGANKGGLARIGDRQPAPGSAVFLTEAQEGHVNAGSLNHPSLLLIPESESGEHGPTHVRAVLKDGPHAEGPLTRIALNRAAVAKLKEVPDSTELSLTVHMLDGSQRTTYNAVGYIKGTDGKAGTILFSAHLDHLGVQDGAVYKGADDDASGTTAVLELARAFAAGPRPRRSILFICYGSEEIGLLGGQYFLAHTPIPISSLVANVEFEMIGAQDPKMPKGFLMFTGWDRSNLGPVLRQHGAHLGPDSYPEEDFFRRSDNYTLARKGVVAHTAGGWPVPPYYHQPSDDLQHLDVVFMTNAIQSLVAPLEWLANSQFRPRWLPGKDPSAR